ncbi:hypothetical protein [uncultured Croceitalea sp.]|uniref:hypothetical protein n=1 Tax=uncultured Croceitalea sp. TaxID=1798908 RepID=UPI0033059314
MLINEDYLNRDFKDIVDLAAFKHSASMHSSLFSYSSIATHFNPYTFFIVSRKQLAINEKISKLSFDSFIEDFRNYESSNKTFTQKLNFLLKQSTWMHEVRHFHDCFATSTGIYDFIKTVSFIDEILKELKSLKDDGQFLKEPLSKTFIDDNKATDYFKKVNRLLQLCYNMKIYKTLFNGDLPAETAEKDLLKNDIVWFNYKWQGQEEGLKIPTIPMEIKLGSKLKSLLQPLGFRALTEANAVILQNHYLRSFGQDYVKEHIKLLRSQPVYLAINSLLTRITKRNNININDFGGDAFIYENIDYCLHNGVAYNPKQNDSHPISKFLNLISDSSPLNDELKNSDIFDKTILLNTDIISKFENVTKTVALWILDNVWSKAKDGYKATLENVPSLSSSIHKPIFNLASTGRVPNPPFSIQGNLIGYGDELDVINKLYQVIIPWIFIVDIVDSLVLARTFKCPIAYGKFGPLKNHKNFIVHDACKTSSPNGICGKIEIGSTNKNHVDCEWKQILKNLALIQ